MNVVVLMGRLTKDPDVRMTQSGTAIADYTLAVDRRIKRDGEASADFIRCKSFGRGAEFAEKYLKKGTKISVTGRIETGSYKDKDGKTVFTTDVIVDSHEFAESKSSDSSGNYMKPVNEKDIDGFMSVPDGIQEELPFV